MEGQTAAFEAMREEIGESISIMIYSHDHHSYLEVSAVRGQTSPESQSTDHPGLQVTSHSVDFLLLNADIPEDYTPSVGDTITDESGDVYTMMAQGDNRVWRWSGPGKNVMRIHTKPEEERTL